MAIGVSGYRNSGGRGRNGSGGSCIVGGEGAVDGGEVSGSGGGGHIRVVAVGDFDCSRSGVDGGGGVGVVDGGGGHVRVSVVIGVYGVQMKR